jgi:hypothetical protein
LIQLLNPQQGFIAAAGQPLGESPLIPFGVALLLAFLVALVAPFAAAFLIAGGESPPRAPRAGSLRFRPAWAAQEDGVKALERARRLLRAIFGAWRDSATGAGSGLGGCSTLGNSQR